MALEIGSSQISWKLRLIVGKREKKILPLFNRDDNEQWQEASGSGKKKKNQREM
uniref:Uncharacterized protein n=1 Tax=Nelumbo nucifera TaxID=4432 RepID=A0A822ZI04_NELNU|nr:TPA_asm: hypothetical protein HUJ06_003974 [Nelumbo nucifera]